MTKEELISNIKETYSLGVGIIEAKNSDYATPSDPWKNFRLAEAIGISPKKAILIRILDKIARISNLLDKEEKVKDETIQDSLLDCINYTAILKAYIDNEKKENQK